MHKKQLKQFAFKVAVIDYRRKYTVYFKFALSVIIIYHKNTAEEIIKIAFFNNRH